VIIFWYNWGTERGNKAFFQIGSGDHMLNKTEAFLKWQAANSKAKLSSDQKRRARFRARLLRNSLLALVDAKYQAELDADTEVSGSAELSGNLGWGSNGYHGDDELPSGSIDTHGDLDLDGFQVVDTEGLSDEEDDQG